MKSLFLGSAIAVAAATGAQAADPILDVKAPREPVYRCDITGFIELPGTDICFKVGGYARLTIKAGDNWPDGYYADVSGAAPDTVITAIDPATGIPTALADTSDLDENIEFLGYGRLNFDARTVTEYGTVRAFIEFEGRDANTSTGGPLNLRHAFVQFGNWTFGKTWSAFADGSALGTVSAAFTTVGDVTFRTDQVRYTQTFGGGFSAVIAVEEGPRTQQQPYVYAPAIGLNGFPLGDPGLDTFGTAYVENSNDNWPALVAALQVEGDWGHARLSGVITQNDYTYIERTGAGTIADPFVDSVTDLDDEIGWGVNFGLGLNAPMFGADDNFTLLATYTDGAGGYGYLGNSAVVTFDCNGPLVAGAEPCITDTATAWSVAASFQHFWTPTLNSTIGGGYASVDTGEGTQYTSFDNGLVGFGDEGYVLGDGDFSAWDVFANVEWTPVSNLAFLLEARYGQVDGGYEYAYDTDADGDIDYSLDGDRDAWAIGFDVVRSF